MEQPPALVPQNARKIILLLVLMGPVVFTTPTPLLPRIITVQEVVLSILVPVLSQLTMPEALTGVIRRETCTGATVLVPLTQIVTIMWVTSGPMFLPTR